MVTANKKLTAQNLEGMKRHYSSMPTDVDDKLSYFIDHPFSDGNGDPLFATRDAHKTMDDPKIKTATDLFKDKRCTRSSDLEKKLLDKRGNWSCTDRSKKQATTVNINFVEKFLLFEQSREEVAENNRKKMAKSRAAAAAKAAPVNTPQDDINLSIRDMLLQQNKRHDAAAEEMLQQNKAQFEATNELKKAQIEATNELTSVNKRVNVVEGDVANLKGDVVNLQDKTEATDRHVEDVEYETRKIRGEVQLQGSKQATTDADVENLTEQLDNVTGVLASAIKSQARKTKDPELKAGYKALTGDSLSTNPSSINSPRLSDASAQAFGDVDVSSPGDGEFNFEEEDSNKPAVRKSGWFFG